MKNILISFLLLISTITQAGLPPTTLSGQSQTLKPTTFTFKTPYSQSTQISGIQSLIETGNRNMLVNPDFEGLANTVPAGWTCTTGTCTKTTASGEFSSGLAAMKIVPTANVIDVSQTVTVPSGIQKQGFARLIYRVPATCSTLSISSLINGVAQTVVNSTNLNFDDTFRSFEIPLTFGVTSAAIKISAATTCTGNIFVDGAVLSQGLGLQNLQLDNVFSAKISSAGVITEPSKSGWITGCNSTAPYTCTLVGFAVAPNCSVQVNDDASAGVRLNTVTATSVVYRTVTATPATTNAPVHIICQKAGNDYLAASANVFSQASADTDWVSYSPTFGSGFGTVSPSTNQCKYARDGSELVVECSFTAGTVAASLGSISLPTGLALDASKIIALNTTASPGQAFGLISQNGATNGFANIVTATGTSTSLVYAAGATTRSTILTPANIVVDFVSSALFNARFRVPIAGWTNAPFIVGSFEKIESCASNTECQDDFGAAITTTSGAVTNENFDFISTCNANNPTTCNFNTGFFTVSPNCNVSVSNNSASLSVITALSSTSVTVSTKIATTGLDAGSIPFTLQCQKSGVDAKPKTAKIATSIGVPTVPGIVGVATGERIDTFSVSYGTTNATTVCSASPCSFLDQIGNSVTNFTRTSANNYQLNALRTYIKLKCTGSFGNGLGDRGYSVEGNFACSNCSVLPYKVSNSTGNGDTFGTVTCQGTY